MFDNVKTVFQFLTIDILVKFLLNILNFKWFFFTSVLKPGIVTALFCWAVNLCAYKY